MSRPLEILIVLHSFLLSSIQDSNLPGLAQRMDQSLPAFNGFIESTLDALLIFEGCRQRFLPTISRRLQEFEKRAQVVSGAVFVFDEQATGIKRWTDGLSWSPSRTLGNFLVYRELDRKIAVEGQVGEDGLPIPVTSTRPAGSMNGGRGLGDSGGAVTSLNRTRERALVGSLTSSYRFRSDGLVKKTISLGGQHMIGYYRLDDVTSGRLRTPSSHPELSALEISSILLVPAGFRVPPVVDVGIDGVLRYRGEPDSPPSPLAGSEYSQGGSFGTPGAESLTRPNSIESSQATFSPPNLPAPAIKPLLSPSLPEAQPPPPPPARRGSGPSRTFNNRYDPYPLTRSPSLSSSTNAYPSITHSPNMRASVSHNGFSSAYGEQRQSTSRSSQEDRSAYISDRAESRPSPASNFASDRVQGRGGERSGPVSERVRANSSSVLEIGSAGGGYGGQAYGGGQQLSRVQSEQSSSFYQPRHSVPATSHSSIQPRSSAYNTESRGALPSIAAAGPPSNVFAYQIPPTNRHPRSLTSPMPVSNYASAYTSNAASRPPPTYVTNSPYWQGAPSNAPTTYQSQSQSQSQSLNSTPAYSQQSHNSESLSSTSRDSTGESHSRPQSSASSSYHPYQVLSTPSYPAYYESYGNNSSEQSGQREGSTRGEMNRSLSERERIPTQEEQPVYSQSSQPQRRQSNQGRSTEWEETYQAR